MRPRTLIGQSVHTHIAVHGGSCQLPPVFSYRHRYQCWACKFVSVLEFEPDASEPSWTECHECGIDNEIAPGLYDRPAVIPGHVPNRIV